MGKMVRLTPAGGGNKGEADRATAGVTGYLLWERSGVWPLTAATSRIRWGSLCGVR
ncbi:hypothetical protein Ri1_38080 [Aeromonas dhakensis]|nr:hypothetical protein Ri1_38080 [Aeromonas dhakensis]